MVVVAFFEILSRKNCGKKRAVIKVNDQYEKNYLQTIAEVVEMNDVSVSQKNEMASTQNSPIGEYRLLVTYIY